MLVNVATVEKMVAILKEILRVVKNLCGCVVNIIINLEDKDRDGVTTMMATVG